MTMPVFVDGSGRRRRLLTVVGVALGVSLLLGLVVVIVGFLGASPVPLPGLTGSDAQPGEVHQPAVHPSAPGSSDGPSAARRAPAPGVTPAPGSTNTITGTPTPTTHRHASPSRSHPGGPK
jgi:hypothetical protein